MNAEMFSWVVTIVGLIGFWLAGNKVWWAWYINIANQVMWVIFAVVSGYYAFLLGTAFYLVVFIKNAIQWTRDHLEKKRAPVFFHNHKYDPTFLLRYDKNPRPMDELAIEITADYYDKGAT